jgi:hypothetical protein
MRELSVVEGQMVAGGTADSIGDAVLGMITGTAAFGVMGALMGGKYGTGGWWGFGALSQLVGWLGSGLIGMAAGSVIGTFMGGKDVIEMFKDYVLNGSMK